MVCVLLCAGYATRMYPLTENYPKPLLPIKDKPLIDYLIDDLQNGQYIKKYIVVSNHKFIDYFKEWQLGRNENIVILDDGSTDNDNRLGAVKDLLFAIEKESIKDDILVLAGDNLVDFSLNSFIEFSNKISGNLVMAYQEDNIIRLRKTGVITIGENFKVLTFDEKPANPKSNFAVPPFYIFKRSYLHKIRQGISQGCGVDAPGMLIEWFVKNSPVYAWLMTGKRIDIGNVEDYQRIAQKNFN